MRQITASLAAIGVVGARTIIRTFVRAVCFSTCRRGEQPNVEQNLKLNLHLTHPKSTPSADF